MKWLFGNKWLFSVAVCVCVGGGVIDKPIYSQTIAPLPWWRWGAAEDQGLSSP